MKKAIAYTRQSDKDQSSFSPQNQEKYIREFAARSGYEIIAVYTDDGRSAKNFDRPDWKKLEAFCKQNFKVVDALIVSKYDRFSRNLKDALNMIELLEEKFGIRILSAMEPIMLNPSSPYFFQFRTQMLMGAQVEWLVIKDRTKFGNYCGAKAGRYFSTAPVGYKNAREEGDKDKPIILIDEARAPVIRRMFTMLLQGASFKEIGLEAARGGYGNRGHSAIQRTLSNPVYAGFIKVPAYGDDPGGWLTKGLHQPIIDEATYYRAQDILNPKAITRTVMNEAVPLRSVLKCFCGRCLTAGNSKGRKRYYWYYRCDNHSGINLNADKLHEQLERVWIVMSLADYQVDYLKGSIEKKLAVQMKDQEALVAAKKKELAGLQMRLDNVEEKFILDQLDAEAYKKWKHRYSSEMALCQRFITDYSAPISMVMAQYEERLPYLGNLHWFYQKAPLHEKQAFVRQVFKSMLYYREDLYRTAYLLPIFQPKALILKEKRLLEYEQPVEKMPKNQDCAPSGTSLEPLADFLQLLAQIKAA